MDEYLTDILTQQEYRPVAALVVYKHNVHYDNSKAYAEVHRIDNDGKLHEGRPLTPKGLKALCSAFEDDKKPHGTGGKIPATLLWVDVKNETYIWYNPPGKHYMSFSSNKLPDGEYFMPGVIFKTDGVNLWAWAFKGKRPLGNPHLLHGPFFNNYQDGRMCLGNASAEKGNTDSFEDVTRYWETLFWNSVNSHPIYWPKHPEKEKQMSLEQAVLLHKDKPFNPDILVKTQLKLEDLYGE